MNWEMTLWMFPGLILGLTCHEFAHAWSASLLGDNFARRQGRVSLNPLRHLTPLGTFALLFLPMGWGRPVPVNLYNFKHPRRDYLITSLAGPFANLCLAALCLGLMHITRHPFRFEGWLQSFAIQAHTFLLLTLIINVVLATFNLIPIPPLDGSKIWPCLLPNVKPAFQPKTNIIFLVFFLVLVFSHGLQPIIRFVIERAIQCVPQSDAEIRMSESVKAGYAELQKERWAEAERHFSVGLAVDPYSDACYCGRAIALYRQQKYQFALKDIDQAIKINFTVKSYHELREEILLALSLPGDAKDSKKKPP